MLTVLTTSMGAGTYAKFVSRVSASGGSKGAGFLITSTNSSSDVDLTASTLMAPSQSKEIDITFSYYSQVLTQFKSNTTDITITGTGALEVGIYKLLEEYMGTWLPAHSKDYADNETNSPTSFEEMFSITFDGFKSMAEACAIAVGVASGNKLAIKGTVVEAMPNNATKSLSCTVTATLTWKEISDAWDTFIGNKVYEYMQTNSGKHTGITVNIGVTAEQCFSVLVDGTTNIPNGYFQGRKDIKEVVIPEGVTTIGDNAFQNCSNLEKVEIPEGVTSIGANAFQNCTSLKEVTIPNTVKTINSNTFQNCTNLESVKIPEGVTRIGANAFDSCSSLTEVEIPSTVTNLGPFTFKNNTNLTKITLSADAMTYIGAGIFQSSNSIEYNIDGNGCYLGNESNKFIMLVKPVNKQISSISINENCKLIAGYALQSCSRLTELIVPEGVKTIGDYAFENCNNITTVNLPSTIENVNSRVFLLCSNLQNINFPSGNAKYGSSGSCIYEKTTKTLIVAAGINPIIPDDGSVEIIASVSIHPRCPSIFIPKTITKIQEYAFLSYSNLEEILIDPENPNHYVSGNCLIERSSGLLIVGYGNCTIPDDGSVKVIGRYAIYGNTKIEKMVIPEGVTELRDFAIASCRNLTEITISKTVNTIDASNFGNCLKLTTIRFTGTAEEWAAKSYSKQDWVKGKNIIFNA